MRQEVSIQEVNQTWIKIQVILTLMKRNKRLRTSKMRTPQLLESITFGVKKSSLQMRRVKRVTHFILIQSIRVKRNRLQKVSKVINSFNDLLRSSTHRKLSRRKQIQVHLVHRNIFKAQTEMKLFKKRIGVKPSLRGNQTQVHQLRHRYSIKRANNRMYSG